MGAMPLMGGNGKLQHAPTGPCLHPDHEEASLPLPCSPGWRHEGGSENSNRPAHTFLLYRWGMPLPSSGMGLVLPITMSSPANQNSRPGWLGHVCEKGGAQYDIGWCAYTLCTAQKCSRHATQGGPAFCRQQPKTESQPAARLRVHACAGYTRTHLTRGCRAAQCRRHPACRRCRAACPP